MSTLKLRSVLCVDDDADICEVVQATLCLVAGLDVRIARSGERVLEIASVWQPDLILMDIMMPGLDGPATFKRLRANLSTAGIAVIFLTAKMMPAELEELLRLGALGVIGKPFDPLTLGDQVFALWEASGRGRPNTVAPPASAGLEAQIDPLVERFIGRARNDIKSLRRLIDQARQNDLAALHEVQRIAHSIHGTGAMLGFSRVSAAGEAIERLVAGITANVDVYGAIGESALVRQISECIERLALTVETAAQTVSIDSGMFRLRRVAP